MIQISNKVQSLEQLSQQSGINRNNLAPRFYINNQYKESNINSYSIKGTPNIMSKNKNKNPF